MLIAMFIILLLLLLDACGHTPRLSRISQSIYAIYGVRAGAVLSGGSILSKYCTCYLLRW